MGCDIHMYIEYKCGNGMPWQADNHHRARWIDRCRDDQDMAPEEWCDRCRKDGETQLHCDRGYLTYNAAPATGRSYALFAQLASVRGTSHRLPLGLPADVSEQVKVAAEAYGPDGHSHSHISLEEFKKVLFEECAYEATDRDDAFFDPYMPYGERPPSYTTVVTYCDNLINEKSMDKQLLGEDTLSEVQVRLVFWFDN